jgi:hypothetical protein
LIFSFLVVVELRVLGETAAQVRSRQGQARRNGVPGKGANASDNPANRAERVLAQRDRGSVSENAPLKDRLNETILARRPGIENRRNLLRLNLSYVNDVWKKSLKRSEPYRLRNHLGRYQGRRLQVFATRQITASISFLRLREMLFLWMHRTLRIYIRL